ncbi:MAG: hypothetical protein J6X89_07025 [Bacteroidales bacterium]|nr:hypothetical protein [Bacteroidales bacterium]
MYQRHNLAEDPIKSNAIETPNLNKKEYCSVSQYKTTTNELLSAANSVEEDIRGLSLLERIKYADSLFNQMTSVRRADICDIKSFDKAETHVYNVYCYLLAEYKSSMKSQLARRVAETPYCSFAEPVEKDRIEVEVSISELYVAEIIFIWGRKLHFRFYQFITEKSGFKYKYEVAPRWKVIPSWLKALAIFNRGHFEKDVNYENWIDVLMNTSAELKENSRDIVTMCSRSSNIDPEGNLKNHYGIWKSKGRIISLSKKLPIARTAHAKKDKQPLYDHSPYMHGSNGTYVENINEYWCLEYTIYSPSPEVRYPISTGRSVHDYITQSLMPRLGWINMSQKRRDMLNALLAGTKLELETSDTTEAALARDFHPVGFKSWDEYLDSIILPKL